MEAANLGRVLPSLPFPLSPSPPPFSTFSSSFPLLFSSLSSPRVLTSFQERTCTTGTSEKREWRSEEGGGRGEGGRREIPL